MSSLLLNENVSPNGEQSTGNDNFTTTSEKEQSSKSTVPEETNEAKAVEDGGGGIGDYFRIFTFASRLDIIFNLVGAGAAIGAGATLPLMTIVFGGFVTKFADFGSGKMSPDAFRNEVNSFTLWFIYLFIGKFVLTYAYTTLFTISALRITGKMRSEFMKAILHQDISFFDDVGPGSIAVKVTTNANLVNAGIAEKLGRLLQSLSMVVVALIVGLTQSWKLTLIIVPLVPPIFIVLGITMTIDTKIEADVLRIYSRASNLAEEVLGSITTVRAFGAAERLLIKYDEWLRNAAMISGPKKSLNLAFMYGGEFFFSYVPYPLAFWQGSRMYVSGEIASVGLVTTVVFSVIMIAASISQIAPAISSFIRAGSAASELFDTLDRPPSITSLPGTAPTPSTVFGQIRFHNVRFSYPSRPGVQILKGISFDVPANKVTALVGASGSGKSTTIGILERWYEPSSGYVTIDGHRIDQLDTCWLRSNMRLVQQEPVLFNDTIFKNIIQGLTGSEHENATEEVKRKLVREACVAANAAEFIEALNEGYDTNVGERAGLLSGGQKQRIAIARSIISNPRVLLLDEATSALDAQSEGIVQNALDRVSKSRTTIVIAHKLATVMKADNIIVLDRGQIMEQGTHQELLGANGAYAKLVRAQDLGDTKGPKNLHKGSDIESNSEDILGETIEKKTTTVQSSRSTSDVIFSTKRRSLIRCLIIFLSENGSLWPEYLALIIISLVAGGIFPVQAILITKLINAFQKPENELRTDINFYSLMFFVVALVTLAAYGGAGWVSNTMSQVLTRRYRLEMLQSLLRQDIAFFNKPENAGAALTSRLSTNPTGLQDLLGMNLMLIASVVVNLLSSTILAIVFGWKLSLVVFFGALPLIFGSGYLRIRLEMKFDDQNSFLFADSARFASEAVGAMRTVVSFTMENSVSTAYDARLKTILENSYVNTCTKMIWYALADSVEFLAMALSFWYGSRLLASGEYNTEQFFIIFIAIIFGGQAAGQFFAYTPNITKAHGAANYILDLRHSQAVIKDEQDCVEPDPDSGFTFDNLHFRYPLRPHVPVLQGLDLSIQPGTSVAFVGGSGCGKSTTIGLLERYYDPTRGSISLGASPLPSLKLSSYRTLLSPVSQEPTLYQGSIRENISLGSVSPATEEQIIQAARDANIYDFISSLPEGLNTDCGGRGMQLSGGQKQRIAIARALIRNPRILLLDEATSALDTTSEKIVQETLRNAAKGRTTISVAHRLSTVRDCDQIFVFENGRVAEAGTHTELLALGGRYQKMCEAQSLDAAVER